VILGPGVALPGLHVDYAVVMIHGFELCRFVVVGQ